MTEKITHKEVVSLDELKRNLRFADADKTFDDNLQPILGAAIAAAGKYVGRDLGQVSTYTFPFDATTLLTIDNACTIERVTVNDITLALSDWCYSAGYLNIYSDTYTEADTVTVHTRYSDDVRLAVIMHATAVFTNPTDSVETLQKASTNLLKPYRQYGN